MNKTKTDILASYKEAYKGTNIKRRIRSSYNPKELARLEDEAKAKFKRGGK